MVVKVPHFERLMRAYGPIAVSIHASREGDCAKIHVLWFGSNFGLVQFQTVPKNVLIWGGVKQLTDAFSEPVSSHPMSRDPMSSDPIALCPCEAYSIAGT